MKRIIIILPAVLILGVLAFAAYSTQSPDEYEENRSETLNKNDGTTLDVTEPVQYEVDASDFLDGAKIVEGISLGSGLTQAEEAGLLLMREEEKLARDVYLTMYKQWNLRIFNNIAASEQTHMDAMKSLLDRYEVGDPVIDDAVGEFTDPEIQELFDRLTEQGERSLQDALKVGATVEDLDIYDLARLMDETDKKDIISVYKNLQKGSRNHLRAFVAQIEQRDETYIPQYVSAEEYEEILSTPQERGRM